MGLELFAKVDKIIDDFINKITCDLINNYDMVYSRKKNIGFVHKGNFYQNSATLLFLSLYVYGYCHTIHLWKPEREKCDQK